MYVYVVLCSLVVRTVRTSSCTHRTYVRTSVAVDTEQRASSDRRQVSVRNETNKQLRTASTTTAITTTTTSTTTATAVNNQTVVLPRIPQASAHKVSCDIIFNVLLRLSSSGRFVSLAVGAAFPSHINLYCTCHLQYLVCLASLKVLHAV